MNKIEINKKVADGATWSLIAEVVSKLISPITNMILARLLTPEAFGIVATLSIVISFAEMLADGGFQKYIIQHEFSDDKEKNNSINVAFWTNLVFSFILWIVIALLRNPIASALGSPDLGLALMVAAIQIPLFGLTSIQLSIFRREFHFKSYFYIRIITAAIPLIITVPLASLGFGYWSLIIGTITTMIVSLILYTILSKWKPSFFYSFRILKMMLSFTIWTMLESISIWVTGWIDTILLVFIINDTFYLGLYKNSVVAVSGILNLFIAAIIPVLFSGLSRLQNDKQGFMKLFYAVQKFAAYILIPTGVGIFVFRNVITFILLGNDWIEGSLIIGLWGIISVFVILLSNFNSEIFRSKGKPKLSLLVQLLHIIILVPSVVIGAKMGFWEFIYIRSFVRIQLIASSLLVLKFTFSIKIKDIFLNIIKPFLITIPMTVVSFLLNYFTKTYFHDLIAILISAIVYAITFILFARKEVISLFQEIKHPISSNKNAPETNIFL